MQPFPLLLQYPDKELKDKLAVRARLAPADSYARRNRTKPSYASVAAALSLVAVAWLIARCLHGWIAAASVNRQLAGKHSFLGEHGSGKTAFAVCEGIEEASGHLEDEALPGTSQPSSTLIAAGDAALQTVTPGCRTIKRPAAPEGMTESSAKMAKVGSPQSVPGTARHQDDVAASSSAHPYSSSAMMGGVARAGASVFEAGTDMGDTSLVGGLTELILGNLLEGPAADDDLVLTEGGLLVPRVILLDDHDVSETGGGTSMPAVHGEASTKAPLPDSGQHGAERLLPPSGNPDVHANPSSIPLPALSSSPQYMVGAVEGGVVLGSVNTVTASNDAESQASRTPVIKGLSSDLSKNSPQRVAAKAITSKPLSSTERDYRKHLYFRLPVVQQSSESEPDPANPDSEPAAPNGGIKDRLFYLLEPLRVLLTKEHITSGGLLKLVHHGKELLQYAKGYLVEGKRASNNSEVNRYFAVQFLIADFLYCVCALEPVQMETNVWWSKVMTSMLAPPRMWFPPQTSGGPRSPSGLAMRFVHAFELYRRGERPDPVDVVKLKHDIFFAERTKWQFTNRVWNSFRADNRFAGESSGVVLSTTSIAPLPSLSAAQEDEVNLHIKSQECVWRRMPPASQFPEAPSTSSGASGSQMLSHLPSSGDAASSAYVKHPPSPSVFFYIQRSLKIEFFQAHLFFRLPTSEPPAGLTVYTSVHGKKVHSKTHLKELLEPLRQQLTKEHLASEDYQKLIFHSKVLIKSKLPALYTVLQSRESRQMLEPIVRRFLVADALLSVCEVVGPAMEKEKWWAEDLLPTLNVPKGDENPTTLLGILYRRFFNALELYKQSKRPSPKEVVELKQFVFHFESKGWDFNERRWDAWRIDNRLSMEEAEKYRISVP